MEPVFEIDALKARVLQLLQERGGFTPTGTVATALGVPLWAADCALEAAFLAGEAQFEAGAGWTVREPAPAAPAAEEGQLDLDGGRACLS